MLWFPSTTAEEKISALFASLQPIFVAAFNPDPLRPKDFTTDNIYDRYVIERQGYISSPEIKTNMLGALPACFAKSPIGYYEADVLDLLVNHPNNRRLCILSLCERKQSILPI